MGGPGEQQPFWGAARVQGAIAPWKGAGRRRKLSCHLVATRVSLAERYIGPLRTLKRRNERHEAR
eukprot:15448882-Alexandrium_andersonii.AAC.1